MPLGPATANGYTTKLFNADNIVNIQIQAFACKLEQVLLALLTDDKELNVLTTMLVCQKRSNHHRIHCSCKVYNILLSHYPGHDLHCIMSSFSLCMFSG